MRGRFAVGLLERIAAWRGCSRSLQGYSCGLEAEPGSRIELTTQAALFSLAAGWQLRPHLFTSPRQAFEPDDVDRWAAWGWVGRKGAGKHSRRRGGRSAGHC